MSVTAVDMQSLYNNSELFRKIGDLAYLILMDLMNGNSQLEFPTDPASQTFLSTWDPLIKNTYDLLNNFKIGMFGTEGKIQYTAKVYFNSNLAGSDVVQGITVVK